MDGHQLTVPAAPAETAAVEAPTQAATAETSAEAGVRKAKAAKAGVEETRVSKAGVDKAKAVEPWVKEGNSETTVRRCRQSAHEILAKKTKCSLK